MRIFFVTDRIKVLLRWSLNLFISYLDIGDLGVGDTLADYRSSQQSDKT